MSTHSMLLWRTEKKNHPKNYYQILLNNKSSEFTSYRIYPKYSDTSTPYHTCSKIWISTIYYPILCLQIVGWVANSADSDEMPHSVVSHLGLHFLLRPVCPNTYGKYGSIDLQTEYSALSSILFWNKKFTKWLCHDHRSYLRNGAKCTD